MPRKNKHLFHLELLLDVDDQLDARDLVVVVAQTGKCGVEDLEEGGDGEDGPVVDFGDLLVVGVEFGL